MISRWDGLYIERCIILILHKQRPRVAPCAHYLSVPVSAPVSALVWIRSETLSRSDALIITEVDGVIREMIFPDHEFVVVVVVVDTSQRVERLTRPSQGQSSLGGRCDVLCWVNVFPPLVCHGLADSLLTSLVRVRSV